MKKPCLIILLWLGAISSYSQNAGNISISPAETFAERKGTVLQKRFDEIGKINSLNIQVEYISDLNTSDKIRCIRFDIPLPNNSGNASALLDTNEVNGLISFIKYLSASVINLPPVDPNTEISFTDNYNLQAGCFWQKGNGWMFFLRTDSQNPSTEVDISQDTISLLLKTLRSAKAEIQKS